MHFEQRFVVVLLFTCFQSKTMPIDFNKLCAKPRQLHTLEL